MNVHLLYKDRDFDKNEIVHPGENELIQDLELDILFQSMAFDDPYIYSVVKSVLLHSLQSTEEIIYRQNILKDCMLNAGIIVDMYDLAVETIESERKNHLGIFGDHPNALLGRSVDVSTMCFQMLKNLSKIGVKSGKNFQSEGFQTFFSLIKEELNHDYFATVQKCLKELEYSDGILMSASLGKQNIGKNYTLRKAIKQKQSWIKQIFDNKDTEYTIMIDERDQSEAEALSELREQGINSVANTLAQSNDHILRFFGMIKLELGFYIGCINLYKQLDSFQGASCYPIPVSINERTHSFENLYNICLGLKTRKKVVGNDLTARNQDIYIITGANQGGKSTFTKSIGLSQLMMQGGMFVPASSFRGSICSDIFTHFRREEDNTMKSGKLDEELDRFSKIVDYIKPNAMVLFNESFSATNEREGSEIAREIITALVENHVENWYVTHLYEFSNNLFLKKSENVTFLRADRDEAGNRSFKILDGKPLSTSYGNDLYDRIFGEEGDS